MAVQAGAHACRNLNGGWADYWGYLHEHGDPRNTALMRKMDTNNNIQGRRIGDYMKWTPFGNMFSATASCELAWSMHKLYEIVDGRVVRSGYLRMKKANLHFGRW
jgi:hypothetical protein